MDALLTVLLKGNLKSRFKMGITEKMLEKALTKYTSITKVS